MNAAESFRAGFFWTFGVAVALLIVVESYRRLTLDGTTPSRTPRIDIEEPEREGNDE